MTDQTSATDGPTRREPQLDEVRKYLEAGEYRNREDFGDQSLMSAEKAIEFLLRQLEQRDAQLELLRQESDARHVRIVELKARAEQAEAAIEAWKRDNKLLTHKIITCGVAASHPDPTLTRTKKCYAEDWNSPQAEAVRKLRDERDALKIEAQTALREREEAQQESKWANEQRQLAIEAHAGAEAALAAVRQQLHAEREAILLLGNENAEMRAELLALRQQLGQAEAECDAQLAHMDWVSFVVDFEKIGRGAGGLEACVTRSDALHALLFVRQKLRDLAAARLPRETPQEPEWLTYLKAKAVKITKADTFQTLRRERNDGTIFYQVLAWTGRDCVEVACVEGSRHDAEFITSVFAQAPLFDALAAARLPAPHGCPPEKERP